MTELDKDFTAASIGEAFKQCIQHMKAGFPIWEEFLLRGFKLHRQLENTTTVFSSFMEGLLKVSEAASRGRAGGTSDIGAGLSNLVSWHKAQEYRIKELNTALSAKLLVPLQSKIEDWKKTTSQMDREHDREVQKAVKEVKESSKSTLKTHKHLESKMKKDKIEKVGMLQNQLDHQKREVSRLVVEMEERERENLSKVLLEERRWYSGFVAGFRKSLDVEVTLFGNVERLQTILSELGETASQPITLPVTTQEFVENWNIPTSHVHTRRPSVHNSSASLASAHSHSSLGSQDSINITAPIPGPSVHPPIPPPTSNGVSAQPASAPQSIPAPVAPVPPPVAPSPPTMASQQSSQWGAQYPQGAQYSQGGQSPSDSLVYAHTQPQQYAQPMAQYAQPGIPAPPMPPAPPGAPPMPPGAPPMPPGAPPMAPAPPPPPMQYAQTTTPAQYLQPLASQQYAHAAPPPPQYSQATTPVQYAQPPSQYAQYPPMGPQGGLPNQLPPPPPPNFPPTPDTYYDPQQPPFPPHQPNVVYDENFEPVSMPSSMSVSPSQASLSSHQSSESGRSLSPPVGPTRSPNQNRAQLSSLQEETQMTSAPMTSAPMDLQTALLSKFRQRSTSFDLNDPTTNHRDPGPPPLPRTTSVGSRAMQQVGPPQGGPRVAHKPPRGPNKPSRSSSLRIAPSAGGPHYNSHHHNHAPNATPPSSTGGFLAGAPPHHVINPNRYSTCSSDSDEIEEESAFARALREKKQRMLNSTSSGLANDSRR